MRPDIYAQQSGRDIGKKVRRGNISDTEPLEIVEDTIDLSTEESASRSSGIPEPGLANITGNATGNGEGTAAKSMLSRSSRRGSGGENVKITADRPIFTLSVAADLLGLHPRTLRIYEEKKLVIPARTDGNRRRYSQNDISRFQAIRQLTRGGVNLEGVRIILEMTDELQKHGVNTNEIIERNLQALNE